MKEERPRVGEDPLYQLVKAGRIEEITMSHSLGTRMRHIR